MTKYEKRIGKTLVYILQQCFAFSCTHLNSFGIFQEIVYISESILGENIRNKHNKIN